MHGFAPAVMVQPIRANPGTGVCNSLQRAPGPHWGHEGSRSASCARGFASRVSYGALAADAGDVIAFEASGIEASEAAGAAAMGATVAGAAAGAGVSLGALLLQPTRANADTTNAVQIVILMMSPDSF
jgi:hypothetical protein